MAIRKLKKKVLCYRLILLLGSSLAILIILASCGPNIPGSSNSTANSTVTVSQLSPTPTNMLPPAGEVTLRTTSVTQYKISFTLANRTDQTILFSDHLTECSVILLQLTPQGLSSQQWQAIAPCSREIATHSHTLAAGEDLAVILTAPGSLWAPGLYRASLTYSLSAAKGVPRTIFSPSFPIGNSSPCQRTDIACQVSPGP
jgi:hypothetical protein